MEYQAILKANFLDQVPGYAIFLWVKVLHLKQGALNTLLGIFNAK